VTTPPTETPWGEGQAVDDEAAAKPPPPRERWSTNILWRVLDVANLRRAMELTKVAVTVFVPLYLLWLFHLPAWKKGFGYDEQFFVWTGWSITKGLAPYRDFVEFKPPVIFLMHALGLVLFGVNGLKFRLLFLWLQMAGFGAVLLALLSRGANKVIACAVSCCAVYFFVQFHETSFADCESVGYAFYMLGAACFLAEAGRERNVYDALGAGFMALCFFSKEPFGSAIVPGWLMLFYARRGPRTLADFWRYFKFSLMGVAVVIGALVLYMAPSGALTAYVKMVRSYALLFSDPNKGYCVVFGRFHPMGSMVKDLPRMWDIINDAFFNLKTFGFVAPAFAACAVFMWRRSIPMLLLGVLTIAGALYSVTPSNCFFDHYYIMSEAGIFLVLYLGVDVTTDALRRATPELEKWAMLVFVATLGAPVFLRYDAEKALANGPRPVPPMEESIPGETAFVIAHSALTDRVVTTGPPGVYFMSNRLNAVRESTFMDEILPSRPGETDVEKVQGWRDDLLKNKPKIIILDPERLGRKVRLTRALFTPFIAEFHYKKVEPYYYVRPD
jgi:hypothetical protein